MSVWPNPQLVFPWTAFKLASPYLKLYKWLFVPILGNLHLFLLKDIVLISAHYWNSLKLFWIIILLYTIWLFLPSPLHWDLHCSISRVAAQTKNVLLIIHLAPYLLLKQSSKLNSPRKASKIKWGQKGGSFLLGPEETPQSSGFEWPEAIKDFKKEALFLEMKSTECEAA